MSYTRPPPRLFLVPYWIVNQLERQRLTLAALADLPTLRGVSSAEDLVLTLLLNQAQGTTAVFGTSQANTGLLQSWTSSPESLQVLQQLNELAPLHATGLQDRLFDAKTLDASYPNPFEIKTLEDGTFVIVIYPGFFGGLSASQSQIKLVRAYLEQWYGYSNFDSVARDPLFKQFLAKQ